MNFDNGADLGGYKKRRLLDKMNFDANWSPKSRTKAVRFSLAPSKETIYQTKFLDRSSKCSMVSSEDESDDTKNQK